MGKLWRYLSIGSYGSKQHLETGRDQAHTCSKGSQFANLGWGRALVLSEHCTSGPWNTDLQGPPSLWVLGTEARRIHLRATGALYGEPGAPLSLGQDTTPERQTRERSKPHCPPPKGLSVASVNVRNLSPGNLPGTDGKRCVLFAQVAEDLKYQMRYGA